MKRVLILVKGLARGGAEQLLVSAARYLDTSRFGYEVAYMVAWQNALVPDLEGAGLPVHCLGSSRLAWMPRLRSLARAHHVDLLHVHSPYAAVGARLAFARPGSLRLVYTEHSVWETYRRLTRWGNLLTFPRNDYVFAVSERVRSSIRYPGPLGFLRMPPVETVYHGVDHALVDKWGPADGVREELGIPEGVPVVGTVANFRPEKGLVYFLRAAAEVKRQVPKVRFVLVGHGPLEVQLRREVRKLGLESAVIFTGYRSDAPRIVSAFDVFALASIQEGLSIALIEAMALGKPVVVTDAGGVPEVVSYGEQGLVVAAKDPQTLSDGLVRVLRDPSFGKRLGEAARRRAAAFDVRVAVRRIEGVYDRLLG